MKVAIFNNHIKDSKGGSELQCHLLASYLSKRFDVVYYAINGKVKYNSCCSYNIYDLKHLTIKQLYLSFKNEPPDVIYWRYDRRKSYIVYFVSRMIKAKFIYAVSHHVDCRLLSKHKSSGLWRGRRNAIVLSLIHIRQYYRSILGSLVQKRANAVILQTDEQLSEISKWINRNKLYVVRNTLNTNEQELAQSPTKFRNKRPYVLWVGSLKRSKRPELLIEIARVFSNVDVDFVVVGKLRDSEYSYFAEYEYNTTGIIYLRELPVQQVMFLMSRCLFTIHTYEKEGFPNVLLQSWFYSKPTINLSYDPDNIISNNRLGKVAHNVEEAISHVRYYLDNREEMVLEGKRAKKYYEMNHDYVNEMSKVESIILSI